jgi:hypothetical protein
MHSSQLVVGERYRYTKDRHVAEEKVDGLLNFFHATRLDGRPTVQLESGINRVAYVGGDLDRRRPLLLLRSSPWKAGTVDTPWHDVFDLPARRAIYFGDHKPSTKVALGETAGNKAMSEAWALHRSDKYHCRLAAPPLLAFRAIERATPSGSLDRKGAVEFLGLARLTNATRITASDPSTAVTYPNMIFELELLPLDGVESNVLDWTWINARRDPSISLESTLPLAPPAWRNWVAQGVRD